jgi:hypothetical protein
MNAIIRQRGATPVGHLSDLGPVEAGAVLYLRLWSDGPESQAQVWNAFATLLGPAEGRRALKSFEELVHLFLDHARRPLLRHGVGCKCLGADEACFATFIGYASEGAQEDALMMATTLVTPHMAPPLVGLAQDFGLVLRRMALKPAPRVEQRGRLH